MKKNPHYLLLEPFTTLNRVGVALSQYLGKLVGGQKVFDLLLHLPVKIEDVNFCPPLFNTHDQELIIIRGKVESHLKPQNSKQPYKIVCYNPTGYFSLVFFKIFPSQIDKFKIGNDIAVLGKIQKHLNDNQINHPLEIVSADNIDKLPKINVIYPLSVKISNKFITHKITEILLKLPESCEEWGDKDFITQHQLPSFYEALRQLHNPTTQYDLLPSNRARQRLAYDELLAWQIAVLMAKKRQKNSKNFVIPTTNLGEKFIEDLPFKLTQSQLNAISEINQDIFSPTKMMRLLQGDVGSGKTVVAIFSALQNIAQHKQICVLVPTTVLATQHYQYFSRLLVNFNINIALLTSATPKKQKLAIIKALQAGAIQILISTHACLEPDIIFHNLGLAIIDEQHRFGVLQRLKLIEKGQNTDLLLMSATPIPRSLMLGLYGDMDISIIAEKPQNRQKIDTLIMSLKKSADLYEAIKRAIDRNEKIYWICPAIEANDEIDLTSVLNKYQELQNIFGNNNVGLLHGKMKDSEKEKIMQYFADENHPMKILIATTVIEVGIDVPSATIIIIENAEHFGLAQLHQLRGRVGRSEKKSFCILLYGTKYGKNSQQRLNILRESNDGFFIAEQDLKIRGSGELLGTKQSGYPEFHIANLSLDHQLLSDAHHHASKIIDLDPMLNMPTSKKYQFLLRLYDYDECLNIINSG